MEKPMFYYGSAYLWTLMLIAFTGVGMAIGLLVAAAGALCWLLYRLRHVAQGREKRKFFLVAAGVVMVACIAFLVQTKVFYEPALEYAGGTVEGRFLVTEVLNDSSSGAHRCVLKPEGRGPTRKLRFSSSSYTPRVGDVFSAKLDLKLLGEPAPEVARYYKSRGLYLGATTKDRVTAEPFREAAEKGTLDPGPLRLAWWNLRIGLVSFREKLTGEIETWLGAEEASLLKGMLLGDKTDLSPETSTALKRAGVLHLFAVSGFHVSLWSMLWYKGVLRLGGSRKLSGGSALLFLFLFVALTGFSKSAIRAGIMLGVFFLGRMLVRSPEPLNSLGVAAFCVLLPNPFYAGDTGVLLSYFATLGILGLYPPVLRDVRGWLKEKVPNYKRRKRVEGALSLLLLSLATFVATLPVVTLSFGEVSLVTVLSNLLVSSAASAAIFLTGIGALFSPVALLKLLTPWCFLGGGLLAKGILFLCQQFSQWSFAYVSLTGKGFGLGLVAALLVGTAGFVLYGSSRDKGMVRVTALLAAIVLLTSVFTDTALSRDVPKVTFLNVSGTCIVLTYRHAAFVIGTGSDEYSSEEGVHRLLQREGISEVTALVVPRESKTESGALEVFRTSFSPRTLLEPSDLEKQNAGTLRLLPSVSLTLYREGQDIPAALLVVEKVPFLLLFRPSADRTVLPPEALQAPVCFCRGKAPDGLKSALSSYIIVSGETGEIEARVHNGRAQLYRW